MFTARNLSHSLIVLLVTTLCVSLVGCQAPASMQRFAEVNQSVVTAVAEGYTGDHALLGVLLDSSLKTQRELQVAAIKRELVSAGYLTPAPPPATVAADTDKLKRDIATPEVTNALVAEVRLGRMSFEQASTWLRDYAASGGFSDPDPPRRGLISQLDPIVRFDAASADLLAAHAARGEGIASALSELDRSAAAVVSYAKGRPIAEVASSVATGVVGSLPQGPRRDAALALLAVIAKTK